MNNNEINAKFLAATDAKTKATVLTAIGKHYGITAAEAEKEVTYEGAEHLLDYLTEPTRTATLVVMQRHGLAESAQPVPEPAAAAKRGMKL